MKLTKVLNATSIILMAIGIIDLFAMNFLSLDANTIMILRNLLGMIMVLTGTSLFIENRLIIKSMKRKES